MSRKILLSFDFVSFYLCIFLCMCYVVICDHRLVLNVEPYILISNFGTLYIFYLPFLAAFFEADDSLEAIIYLVRILVFVCRIKNI